MKMCFLGNEGMNVSFFHGEGSQWIWDEVDKQNTDRAIFMYVLVFIVIANEFCQRTSYDSQDSLKYGPFINHQSQQN